MSIDVKKTLQDAGYVGVGVGVLATQRATERGRALQRAVADSTTSLLDRTQPFVEELRQRIEPLAAQLQVVPDQVNRAIETGRDQVQRFRGDDEPPATPYDRLS